MYNIILRIYNQKPTNTLFKRVIFYIFHTYSVLPLGIRVFAVISGTAARGNESCRTSEMVLIDGGGGIRRWRRRRGL